MVVKIRLVHISIFLTFGNNLNVWNNAGILERELEPFRYLKKYHNFKFTIYTYGNDENLKSYLSDFEIISLYSTLKKGNYKIINIFKSFLMPILLLKKLKNTDLIYQNQLMGSWVSIGCKVLARKPIYIRTGYDMFSFSKLEKKSPFKIYLYKILTFLTLAFCDKYSVTSKKDLRFLKK